MTVLPSCLALSVLLSPAGQILEEVHPLPQDPPPSELITQALVQPSTEARELLLLRADASADALVARDPTSAEALYWKAATAGLLAETAGTREKIELGKRAMAWAEEALARDSTHAGAHHVLGRIHAGVKKLGWFTRLVGRRLGMGPLLDAATWNAAEYHLRRARELEPDNLTFRLEYAVALRDMGRGNDAATELAEVLRRPAGAPLEVALHERACRMLARLREDGCPDSAADGSGGGSSGRSGARPPFSTEERP